MLKKKLLFCLIVLILIMVFTITVTAGTCSTSQQSQNNPTKDPVTNHPPVIIDLTASVTQDGHGVAAVFASDDDNDTLAYVWEVADTLRKSSITGNNMDDITWTAQDCPRQPGQPFGVVITVTVSDGNGGTARAFTTVNLPVVQVEQQPNIVPPVEQGASQAQSGNQSN